MAAVSRRSKSLAISAAILGAVVLAGFTLRIVSTGVAVRGRVIFQGTPRFSGGSFSLPGAPPTAPPLSDESFLLRSDGALANVLVYVKGGAARKSDLHGEQVRVERRNCLFGPRVFGVRVGQSIEFVNRDPWVHNVRIHARNNPSFNLATTANATVVAKAFKSEESPIELRCDIHPWERAYAGVFDHPYFAVTGPDGQFSFPEKLRPGIYTIAAWHEKLGTLEERVLCLGLEETVLFAYESRAP
jgi:plastocyanin